MSASNEWFEYHLTPDGWVKGSEEVDIGGVTEREVPPNVIISLTFHERMSSIYSTPERWYDTEKGNCEIPEEKLHELYKKYGRVPKGYEGYSKS